MAARPRNDHFEPRGSLPANDQADFTAGDGCVIQHTSLGDRQRSREWVEERLSDWHARHDELLRTDRDLDRLDAREIRRLTIELGFVASCTWPVTDGAIPELRPLNCTIRTLDRKLWAATPYDGDAA